MQHMDNDENMKFLATVVIEFAMLCVCLAYFENMNVDENM